MGSTRYSQPLDPTQEKKWRLLAEAGEMHVIGFSQDGKPRHFAQHAHFYLLPNLPVPVLRYLLMFTFGPLLALWCIFRHQAIILVAQSPYEGFAAALAKSAARFLGRQVVLIIESHGDFEVSLFLQRRVLFPKLYRLMMRWTARFALRHADLLRAVSSSTSAQLAKWAPGKPIFQFPAWTDMEVFLKAGEQRIKTDQIEILYAGVLIPRKGIHHLVNAFGRVANQFPKSRLVLIGRAENPAYVEYLKRRVARLGLEKRVEFVNELSQGKLAKRMAQAMVFVLPTYSEGLPRVVLEAMAIGMPVIATAVSGIPEVIQDNVTGFLIPAGNEESLAEKLEWVLGYPKEAAEIGRRARVFVQQFFTPERYVDNYKKIFEEAARYIRRSGFGTEKV